MNTSSYVMYQNHTIYNFKNNTYSIGIEPLTVLPIDIKNLICISPNYKRVIVSDNAMHTPPSSLDYASLISRPDVFQPSYRIANFPTSNVTKNIRQGFSGSILSSAPRKRPTVSIGTNIVR